MCKSPIEEVGGGVGSGPVGLPLRGAFKGQLLIISRNWLPWEGQSLQGQQGPGCQKKKNT